ncbi:recombinase family protein [Nguyenibacter vanlangensis]|uniref:Recombinase family protein n=1 Tax=Nguyenibacter vanlangensis TaxID=1216886 RepID=A0ABZ3D9N5_9PROT
MIYGYACVSNDASDLISPFARLKAAGCELVFRDHMGGAIRNRPQFKKMMTILTDGDVVIIPAVDQLSCSTTDVLTIVHDMRRIGAGLRSLAEPIVDTTAAFSDLVIATLDVAAKLEQRRIVERIARGRFDAKGLGVQFGRKPKLTKLQQCEARSRLEAGETQRSVARSYNVSQATISRLSL